MLTRLVGLLLIILAGCAQVPLRGTGDLGVVVERAAGRIVIVESSARSILGHMTAWAICRMPPWFFRATPATHSFSAAMAA